jgi:2-hydroxycyclohexanecarboxyl-CoA dehydrogenase
MRGLSGKNAVVTGGGSGIGRAICERLCEEGCGTVAILDQNEHGAIETKEQIVARLPNAKLVTYQVDISDQAAVIQAIDHFRDRLAAPIHILVNNAGWDRAVLFMNSDHAFWEKLVQVNLMGPFNVTHATLKHMIKDGGGKVVFVASDAGRVGSSGESVYAACKGGLIAFAKSLGREVARYNILLNSVCPGPTNTPLLAAF